MVGAALRLDEDACDFRECRLDVALDERDLALHRSGGELIAKIDAEVHQHVARAEMHRQHLVDADDGLAFTQERADSREDPRVRAFADEQALAFIGDDINDLEAIRYCGLGVTVADGADAVKEIADFVCVRKGGEGVFREFAELILGAQGKL